MKTSLMQRALGSDWEKLPLVLQKHYGVGDLTETGFLDIEYPMLMQPYLSFLRVLGALTNRRGQQVSTTVEKHDVDNRQYWCRTIRYSGGKVVKFKSVFVAAKGNQLIEYVNPILGLKMSVRVQGDEIHYSGVCYILKLGTLMLPIPENLILGSTSIVEKALDNEHFYMDFRLTHPWFGELFRYAGSFKP